MTREDVIRDMEVCSGGQPCMECSFYGSALHTGECIDHLMKEALALLKGDLLQRDTGEDPADGLPFGDAVAPGEAAYDFWDDDTD